MCYRMMLLSLKKSTNTNRLINRLRVINRQGVTLIVQNTDIIYQLFIASSP